MNENLLQQGDEIRLTNGMPVCISISSMFLQVFRKEISLTATEKKNIWIGQPLILSNHFLLSNNIKTTLDLFGITISDDEIAPFVGSLGLTLSFDTSKFEGEYTVTSTAFDGGDPLSFIPDGYHVFCQKKGDPTIEVDFYQNYNFSPRILPEEIKPLNR